MSEYYVKDGVEYSHVLGLGWVVWKVRWTLCGRAVSDMNADEIKAINFITIATGCIPTDFIKAINARKEVLANEKRVSESKPKETLNESGRNIPLAFLNEYDLPGTADASEFKMPPEFSNRWEMPPEGLHSPSASPVYLTEVKLLLVTELLDTMAVSSDGRLISTTPFGIVVKTNRSGSHSPVWIFEPKNPKPVGEYEFSTIDSLVDWFIDYLRS